MDELTIIGGGCAGLALAAGLSEVVEDLGGAARLLEGRSSYTHDRTWCYWGVEGHPFNHLERFHWRRWKLRYAGRELVRGSDRYPYALLPSGLYYRENLQRIEQLGKIGIERGCEVQGYRRQKGGWVIKTAGGVIHTKVLIEARAGINQDKRQGLVQHFMGQYLRVEADVFDEGTLTLMDFDVDQSRGIHFVYLLPLSANTAYVADTYFARMPMDPGVYRANIRAWLKERYGVSRVEVDGEELGAIPMSCGYAARRLGRGGFALGGAGGAIKSSSGYAFTAIQRQVGQYLDRISENQCWCAPPAARPLGLEWLDRIFLTFMARDPGRMPELFMTLFERCDGDALVRFLSDRPTRGDIIQVIRAAPALGMSAAAIRGLGCWATRG
jgi:lycopene beta-cyclase